MKKLLITFVYFKALIISILYSFLSPAQTTTPTDPPKKKFDDAVAKHDFTRLH